MMNEYSLSQMVKEPTRGENILDLFLTSNPTLVDSVSIIPGLSDHNIVSCVVDISPKLVKQSRRKTFLYRRADWCSFREYMKIFCNDISNLESRSIEDAWQEFKTALNEGISKYVHSKFISGKKDLLWITQSIKREIRRRDRLFQKLKKFKKPSDRKSFLNSKYLIKKKFKQAHDKYFKDLRGINDQQTSEEESKSTFSRKKLFSIIKNSRQDSQGIPLLKQDGHTCTSNLDSFNRFSL